MNITSFDSWRSFFANVECPSAFDARGKAGEVTYCHSSGWHFYSMLKVRLDLQKGESSADANRLVRMFRNYTRAAVRSALMCPKTCKILEHQGNVIHFFFPDTGKDDEETIKRFARDLTALVDTYVIGYYDDAVLQFHMASEYGESVLIHSVSPELGDWSDSTVSLGPSANDPAKKMGDSKENVTRPLWWRRSSGPEVEWNVYDVSSDANNRRDISASCLRRFPNEAFDEVVGPGIRIIGTVSAVPAGSQENAGQVVKRNGFFFRADMDGFTKHVEAAFAPGGSIPRLVEEFVSYMAHANKWEIETDMKVIVHPWAGDCYNSLIVAGDETKEFGMELALKTYPKHIVKSWSGMVAGTNYREMQWVYALSGGDVYTFGVTVEDRSFKLSVGAPAGKTLASVNFPENRGGFLVMPKIEADQTEMEFWSYPNGRHHSFRYNDAVLRDRSGARAVANAARIAGKTTIGGVALAATRPWGCKLA